MYLDKIKSKYTLSSSVAACFIDSFLSPALKWLNPPVQEHMTGYKLLSKLFPTPTCKETDNLLPKIIYSNRH